MRRKLILFLLIAAAACFTLSACVIPGTEPTPSPSATAAPGESPQPSPSPTAQPSPEPSPSPTAQPSPSPEPEPAVLSGLTVTRQPDKTVYVYGEEFDPAGMAVTAVYTRGPGKAVTDYLYPQEALTLGQTAVELTYEEDGVQVSCAVAVSVTNKTFPANSKEEFYAALAACVSGDTVEVHGAIAFADSVVMKEDQAVTLAGADSAAALHFPAGKNGILLNDGAKLTVKNLAINVSANGRAITAAKSDTTLNNSEISLVGSVIRYGGASGRGISFGSTTVPSENNRVLVRDSKILYTEGSGTAVTNRGINVYGSSNSSLTVENSEVTAGHYAVICHSPGLKISVKDSSLTGYAALYLINDGVRADVKNSTLTGRTSFQPASNTFGAVSLEGTDAEVRISGSVIANEFIGTGCSNEVGILFSGYSPAGANNRVYLDAYTYEKMVTSNALYAPQMILMDQDRGNWYVNGVKQENPLYPDVYVSAVRGNDANSGWYPAQPKKTLAAALAAAGDGETVYLMDGPFTAPSKINQSVTILGNGCEISGRLDVVPGDGGVVRISGVKFSAIASVTGAANAATAPRVDVTGCVFEGGSLYLFQTNKNEVSPNALAVTVQGNRFLPVNGNGGIIYFTEEGVTPHVTAVISQNSFTGSYHWGCIVGGVNNAVIADNVFDCENNYEGAIQYIYNALRGPVNVLVARNTFKTAYALTVTPYHIGGYSAEIAAGQEELLPVFYGNAFDCSEAVIWYTEHRKATDERLVIDYEVFSGMITERNTVTGSGELVYNASPYQPTEVAPS